jgi:hypothetical protein
VLVAGGVDVRAVIVLVLLCTAASADNRQAAERHFRIGEKAYKAQNFAAAAEQFEEAYKLLPLPELAFSAAQAYRKQYRIDRKIERAQRSVELYRRYLDAVKTGGHVGAAADGLDAMERELLKHGGKVSSEALRAQEERTTIIVNPELQTERKGGGIFEIADISDADAAKIVVLLDGKPAPVYEKIDVEPGAHKIHVEVDGYLPAEVTERAVKGTTTTATIPLVPRPAKVTVKTERGARIRVDGRAAGTGPVAELELPAGRHVVTLTKQGRESVAREITVTRGQTLVVDEPLEKTTRRKAVPWVAAGAGLFGVLATGAVIGAIVYDGRASDKLDAFESEGDKSPGDVAAYDRYVERRDRLVTAAWITGGAALVIGSAAVALYAFDSPGEAELRVTPTATPDSAGVVVGGRF